MSRHTAPWHVTPQQASAYAEGSLAESDAWSVEMHVESCAGCAQRVSDAVRAGAAAPALSEVRATLLALVTPHASGPETSPAAAVDGTRPGSAPGSRTVPATTQDTRTNPVPGAPPVPGAEGEELAFSRRGSAAARDRVRVSVWARYVAPTYRAHRPRLAEAPVMGAATATGEAPAARIAARRVARLGWAVGPAVRGPWAVALVIVTAAAVGLAQLANVTAARPLLLAIAPLLPVAGIAASYGRAVDPLYETVAATPSAGLRLLLIRTAAVLAVCVPLLTAAGLLMPAAGAAPGPAAWLLPALALTVLTLLIGSFIGCPRAAAVTTAGWVVLLVAATAAIASPDLSDVGVALAQSFAALSEGGPAPGAWAAAAVVCGVLLALRRTSFDRLERL